MNWNRLYRPRTFSELHLVSVKHYFTNLIKGSSFPQAFLFTGPKGTGKTSTARIVGAILNDPANKEVVETLFLKKGNSKSKLQEPSSSTPELESIFLGQSYLVQEMDAASNRGIDDIRALKERVQLPPVQGLVSVYILDEVHMLTTEAFNALLKLLEEPPPQVVFILATTELQKVPETVVSRCQVVQFSLATESELVEAINKVSKAEKITLDPAALQFIAHQANGSFRDAIKLLEQAALLNISSVQEIEASLGRQYSVLIPELISAVLEKSNEKILRIFEQLRSQGSHEVSFHKDIVSFLHQQLLITAGVLSDKSVVPFEAARFLLQELSASELSQPSPLPFLRLELKLLEIVDRALKKTKPLETITKKPSSPPKSATTQPEKKAVELNVVSVENSFDVANSTLPQDFLADNLSGNGELLYQQWPTFVAQVAQTNFSLATLLKSAQPISGEAGKITLGVYYKFHQEQLQQPKFTQQLNDLITTSYGGPVHIQCILNTQPKEAELTEPDTSTQLEKLATDALM